MVNRTKILLANIFIIAVIFTIIIISMNVGETKNGAALRTTGSISCSLCTGNTQPEPCNGSYSNKNFTEGTNDTFTLCAKDDQNDSIFFKLAQGSDTWQDFSLYSNGTVSVTPKKTDVGNHTMYILPLDDCTESCSASATSYKVEYTVNNIDSPPKIVSYSPANNSQVLENHTITISINATDPDFIINPTYYNESLKADWFLDEKEKQIQYNIKNTSFNYTPSWYDQGNHTIKVIVMDKSNKTASISLKVDVKNNDRPPYQIKPMPNITWSENTNSSEINLSDYFADPDLNNNITYIVNTTDPSYDFAYQIYSVEDPENSSILFSKKNTSIKFIPSMDYYGIKQVSINYSDGYITKQSTPFYLNVTLAEHPPRIKQLANQTAIVDVPYYKQIEVNYIDHQSYICSSTNAPSWLNLTSNCSINFTPQLSDIGNYTINITATSFGGLKSNMTFNLSVVQDHAPILDPISNYVIGEGYLFTLDINATDKDITTLGDNLTFSTNSNMFTLHKTNATSARISFTPTLSDVGYHTIVATVVDKWGLYDQKIFAMNITKANHPPKLDNIPEQFPIINYTYKYNIIATDQDGNKIYYYTNDSLIKIKNTTGLINFTPNDSEKGIHIVNISVTDKSLWDWQIVKFNITTNHPPRIGPLQNKEIKQYTSLIYDINATDPENQKLTYSISPPFLSINSETGLINESFSTASIFNITVTAKDTFNATNSSWFILTVNETNLPPNITNKKELSHIILHDNTTTIVPIKAYDAENDINGYHINITGLNQTSLLKLTQINKSYAILNFTPKNTTKGNYSATIWVTDSNNGFDSVNSTIEILPKDHMPIIYSTTPVGIYSSDEIAYLQKKEDQNLNFTSNITDPDNDTIIYNWSIKKGLYGSYKQISNQSNFTYHFGWYDSNYGIIFFKLTAKDIWGMPAAVNKSSISTQWSINVINVDRSPIFGEQIIPNDNVGFSNGTMSNVTDGSLTLSKTNEAYVPHGQYTSPIIFINDIIGVHYRGIFLNKTVIDNQTFINISFRYATNNPPTTDNIIWSPWYYGGNTSYFNLSQAGYNPYTDEQTRYWQIRLDLSTKNNSISPIINSLSLDYNVKNLTMPSSTTNMSWIYSSTFFHDPDNDNNLTYSWNISKGLVFVQYVPSYTNSNVGRFYIGSIAKVAGNDSVIITAKDKYGKKVSSNKIPIYLQETKTPYGEKIVYQTITHTKTQIKTKIQEKIREVKIPEYKSFNLIVPQQMKMYPNDTIIAPITLDNYGNSSLVNITLSANSSNPNVNITIPQDFINGMAPKTKTNASLIINSGNNIYGNYEITVKAHISNPRFNDTAVMMMTGLVQGETNKTMINTKIAFTKDLLTSSPQCREFLEMVNDAKAKLNSKNYTQANEILNNAINGCKDVITLNQLNQTQTEKLSPMISMPQKNVIYGLLIIVGITLILVIVLIFYSKKMDFDQLKNKAEKKTKKPEKTNK